MFLMGVVNIVKKYQIFANPVLGDKKKRTKKGKYRLII